jgi:ubiquinone/menaquinone biosynthesis C-methylase UbiE
MRIVDNSVQTDEGKPRIVNDQHQLVQNQFGGTASSYATSATHNDAAVLADLVNIVGPTSTEKLLDIASGPGTLALTFAPYVAESVALDLTPSMMELAAARAKEAGYTNVSTVVAPAEALPFADEQFDIVTVRTAPHHFADIKRSVSEMVRVLKTGGRLLVVDTTSPEDDALDLQLNEFEKLRDPSHVRNYRPSEWTAMLTGAGLNITYQRIHTHALGKRLEFEDWTTRMRVSEKDKATLRTLLTAGSPDFRALLDVQESADISFTLPEVTILAGKLECLVE